MENESRRVRKSVGLICTNVCYVVQIYHVKGRLIEKSTHFMVFRKPISKNPFLKREVKWYSSWETLEDGCEEVTL